ncbi:MAG TPA: ABC transporter ATP-binding protein, partial [Acidimicrobiales bacterium]|nr:ABC transporter ATP-binding protein [Acidimicrobiales bacterium]
MDLLAVEELRTVIDVPGGTVRAVDGVTFRLAAGETLGLVGESGSGKTMTGMSIVRLLPPGGRIAAGAIWFGDKDLVSLDERQMRALRGSEIGVVFQDPMTSLNPNMPIGEQIAEGVRFHRKVSKQAAMARAVEALGLVGVPRPLERVKDYPHQLSGGLRQRVMIAIALAGEPKLLIADEPTTALDVTIQAQILDLLQDLTSRLAMALILITHDMGVIAGRTDRVMVMYAGRLVEVAATEQLFEETRHPYTEALLASIPKLEGPRDRRLHSIRGLPPDLANPPPGCRFAPRCSFGDDRCRTEEPVLGGSDPSHPFACFHPRGLDDAPPSRASGEASGESATVGADASTAAAELISGNAAAVPAAPGEGASGEVILDLQEVSKEFPVTSGGLLRRTIGALQAVSGVSLQLVKGETFGLVGESGCGKTTLGRMAVALERPTAGRVVFEGMDLATLAGPGLRRARRHFQLMFQDPYASLDPRMRVGQIISEPLEIQEIGDRLQREARVQELLGEVGLSPEAAMGYPHEFSGGQRQRVGLARALALNPSLIVADEPVSALDVSIRSQILNLMKRLQAHHRLTYVVISHDLSVVRYLADR